MAAVVERRLLSLARAAGLYQPLDADLTTIAGLTATSDNFIQSVSSAWASRTPAQVRTSLNLVTGTYTPTLTNVSNVDASTAFVTQYVRVSDMVLVFGQVQIDATASGAATIGMSLPIASDFAAATQAGGTIANAGGTGFGRVFADETNNRLSVVVDTSTTINSTYNFIVGYLIV